MPAEPTQPTSHRMTRRHALTLAATATAATVLAACGDDDGAAQQAPTTTSTTVPPAVQADIEVLVDEAERELVLVEFWQAVLDRDLLTDPLTEIAELFQAQHREHAQLLQALIRRLGGTPQLEASPTLVSEVRGRADRAATAEELLTIAYELTERQTNDLFRTVGTFQDITLNQSVMSIAGVGARQLAVLGPRVGRPAVAPDGFYPIT